MRGMQCLSTSLGAPVNRIDGRWWWRVEGGSVGGDVRRQVDSCVDRHETLNAV